MQIFFDNNVYLFFSAVVFFSSVLIIFTVSLHRHKKNILSVFLNFKEDYKNSINSLDDNEKILKKIHQDLFEKILKEHFNANSLQQRTLAELKEDIQKEFNKYREIIDKRQLDGLRILQEALHQGMQNSRGEIQGSLKQHHEIIAKEFDKLTSVTNEKLKEIGGQVDTRLAEGFAKTTATFTDIVKRLALIDQAQQKITELSTNVVSLQQVLSDKRSRGAFGEVQLAALIRNMMPENSFSFQRELSNKCRVDCMIFLPKPSGNIAVDAKFPLESYKRMLELNLGETDKRLAEQQFRKDVRKHIQSIAEKYIIAGETSDGAIMFIPAEAIFAEIHSNFYDLVEYAHQERVWLVSPTTMMAVLTTARAVLKDEATKKQIHIIHDHLAKLAKDFDRFSLRMNSLAIHINQAHEDVNDVHISAKKISSHFNKIEKVDLKSLGVIE